VDFLRDDMRCNRTELEFAGQTRSGLGIRETRLWLGAKGTLRCLVRLVRRCWLVFPSKEMAKTFPLQAAPVQLRWQASAAALWRWSTAGLNATTATARLSLLSAERSDSVH
jgi:hypothetical protein